MNFLLHLLFLMLVANTQTMLLSMEDQPIERSLGLPQTQPMPKLRTSIIIEKHARAGSRLSPRTSADGSPRLENASPCRNNLKNIPVQEEKKEEKVYEAIKGTKYEGKKFIVLGTCMEFWQVASLTDIAKSKPELFEGPTVQDYCNYLGINADSIEEAKQRVLKSQDRRVKELFSICKQAQNLGFGSGALVAIYQQDLKRIKEK